jgi:hypothetical protein
LLSEAVAFVLPLILAVTPVSGSLLSASLIKQLKLFWADTAIDNNKISVTRIVFINKINS